MDGYFEELISQIIAQKPDKREISQLKIDLCKKHKLKKMPTDIEVLLHVPAVQLDLLSKYLQTKPTRTKSGVAVVAIMSYPFPCPHGECAMCPSLTKQGVPQSYTGKEPASMRGMRNNFDAYLQVMNRLEQYIVLGHNPEKVELIIMGGTFISFDKEYKAGFVADAFMALNDFSEMFYHDGLLDIIRFRDFFELPGEVGSQERTKHIHEKLSHRKKATLENEQKKNETSFIRCVGLTIETRPDYGMLAHADEMLELGATRVELGVQTVYDEALEEIERGHTVQDSIQSTRILKDLGFKINYHVMPGLPNVSKEKDIEGLRKLFEDPAFRPDMLKIYPCMVLKGTKLYHRWKKGEYSPLDAKHAADIISEFKRHVPEYARIMRVQRDIPTFMIEAGVEHTNLRQYIEELGVKCRCIRCREAGRSYQKKGILPGKLKTVVQKYAASEGWEFFVSMEDKENDILCGFCRLRFPSQTLRPEITSDSAIVRELHVYGDLVGLGKEGAMQHTGIGKRLLKKAESIASENGKGKMIVISGIGAREYYRKLGYEKEGPYMVKSINSGLL